MRLITILFILAGGLLVTAPGIAADSIFHNMSGASREAGRLVSEAKEAAVAPIDGDGGGIWRSLFVVGATGLTYVFDNDIRDHLMETKSRDLDKAAEAGSLIGNPLVHLGIAGAVYGGAILTDSPRYQDVGIMMGEASVLADGFSFLLKSGIGRARPGTGSGRDSFRPFSFGKDYDSFPSMHTASSFAMASVVSGTSESMSTSILAYATALFVGFARIYEDKHWASDIIMGAAVGELCGRVVMSTHAREGARRLSLTPAVSHDTVSLSVTGYW